MRAAAVVLALVLASGVVAGQARRCVALRINIPQHETSREIRTPEGKGTAAVQIEDYGEYPTFYLDLTITDEATGSVFMTIRNDRTSEVSVDEFQVRVDGGTIQSATTPPFQVTVLRIFERAGDTCR